MPAIGRAQVDTNPPVQMKVTKMTYNPHCSDLVLVTPRKLAMPPRDGPTKVHNRSDRYSVKQRGDEPDTTSAGRLKPTSIYFIHPLKNHEKQSVT